MSEEMNNSLEVLKELTLFDDDLAGVAFQDKECLEFVLSVILNNKPRIKHISCQKTIKTLKKRDIRLDVLCYDDMYNYYNLEVQRKSKYAPGKRA